MTFIDVDTGNEVGLYLCVTHEDVRELVAFLKKVELSFSISETARGQTYDIASFGDYRIAVAPTGKSEECVELDVVKRLLNE